MAGQDMQQSDDEVTYQDLQMNAAYRLARDNDRVGEVNQADDDSVRTPDTVSVAGAARSRGGLYERRRRTSFADGTSSKASRHGRKRAGRSAAKEPLQPELQESPENLSSHTPSLHQRGVPRTQSPFHEAQPKAQALAVRLAQHYAEVLASSSSGARELQHVRSSQRRKEPSVERKAPVVPPLDLSIEPQKQAYHPTSKKASKDLDQLSKRVIDLANIDDDDDDDGEVDEGFDDGEGTGRGGYKMNIHGEQFNSQMRCK